MICCRCKGCIIGEPVRVVVMGGAERARAVHLCGDCRERLEDWLRERHSRDMPELLRCCLAS